MSEDQIGIEIRRRIQAAIEAERERCAKIAEAFHHISVDGKDWNTASELERMGIYSNKTVSLISEAIRKSS